MEQEEILINEEGALKDVQHHDIRFSDTWAKGWGRHRVFTWNNCKQKVQFTDVLRTCFLVALILTAIRLFIEEHAVGSYYPLDWYPTSLMLLALTVTCVGIVLWLFLKKTTELEEQEVETVSGLTQEEFTKETTPVSTSH